jgi:hypothetical protein
MPSFQSTVLIVLTLDDPSKAVPVISETVSSLSDSTVVTLRSESLFLIWNGGL